MSQLLLSAALPLTASMPFKSIGRVIPSLWKTESLVNKASTPPRSCVSSRASILFKVSNRRRSSMLFTPPELIARADSVLRGVCLICSKSGCCPVSPEYCNKPEALRQPPGRRVACRTPTWGTQGTSWCGAVGPQALDLGTRQSLGSTAAAEERPSNKAAGLHEHAELAICMIIPDPLSSCKGCERSRAES